jgi:hypothetical protein
MVSLLTKASELRLEGRPYKGLKIAEAGDGIIVTEERGQSQRERK